MQAPHYNTRALLHRNSGSATDFNAQQEQASLKAWQLAYLGSVCFVAVGLLTWLRIKNSLFLKGAIFSRDLMTSDC